MAERRETTETRLARLEERLNSTASNIDDVKRRIERLEQRHIEEARFTRGQRA